MMIPKYVRRAQRDIEEHLGLPVEVRPASGGWDIVLEGKHILAAAWFRDGTYRSGVLAVDGERRRILPYPELRRLWMELEEGITPPPMLATLVPAGDPPAEVKHVLARLARKGITGIITGMAAEKWAFGLGEGETGLRVLFSRGQGGHWGLSSIQVVIDGCDRSHEAMGDISRAMALLAQHIPGQPGMSAVQGAAAPVPANSVRVRTRVVIRELAGHVQERLPTSGKDRHGGSHQHPHPGAVPGGDG
jgi:hypothetical protein